MHCRKSRAAVRSGCPVPFADVGLLKPVKISSGWNRLFLIHLGLPGLQLLCRGVAQPGSAPALGAGGRQFESARPDQSNLPNSSIPNACAERHAAWSVPQWSSRANLLLCALSALFSIILSNYCRNHASNWRLKFSLPQKRMAGMKGLSLRTLGIVTLGIVSLLVFTMSVAIGAPLPAKRKRMTLPPDATINEWLHRSKAPIVGIGLIEDGRVKEAKVFGEIREGVPASNNTIFNVASLTKPIVAILTLKLVSAGRWSLDEPLSAYFVDPDLLNDSRNTKITTRLVLTHETGLPNWRGNEPSHKLSFSFDPGANVKYSGEGFQYLREALEHKFGQPREKLSDSLVFRPFHMNDTRHYWDKSMDESRYAGRHDKDGKALPIEKWYEAHAANLLLTTVGDYSKFGVNVMRGAGLSKGVYEEMVSPHFPRGKGLASGENPFGLCWLLVRDLSNGEYALVHSGRNPGVAAVVVLLPKSKRGVVVLTNGENGDQLYKKVIEESLDLGKEIMERLELVSKIGSASK